MTGGEREDEVSDLMPHLIVVPCRDHPRDHYLRPTIGLPGPALPRPQDGLLLLGHMLVVEGATLQLGVRTAVEIRVSPVGHEDLMAMSVESGWGVGS